MKKLLSIFILLLPLHLTHAGNPLSIKQILETPLPSIWANVEEVYIWNKENFKEYKIKKSPSSDALTKFARGSAMCNYLFDADGKKTPFFITYFFGYDWNIKRLHINQEMQYDIYYITIWEETMDDVGKFVTREAGNIVPYPFRKIADKDIPREPILRYFTGKIVETFFIGKSKEHIDYRITFNQSKTKVFLHEQYRTTSNQKQD